MDKRAQSGDSSLFLLSRRKQMSWSQHEPIKTQHTDHWSKLRCKSYKMSKLPTGNFVAFCDNKDTWVQRRDRQKLGLPQSTTTTPAGTLAPVGSSDFNKYLVERLHSRHIVQPHPPQDSRGYEKRVRAPSACSQRAKRGHRYWVDDKRHKLSSPGTKATFGSKGTFLGIGVPRL